MKEHNRYWILDVVNHLELTSIDPPKEADMHMLAAKKVTTCGLWEHYVRIAECHEATQSCYLVPLIASKAARRTSCMRTQYTAAEA